MVLTIFRRVPMAPPSPPPPREVAARPPRDSLALALHSRCRCFCAKFSITTVSLLKVSIFLFSIRCRCPARPLSLPPTIGLVSSSRLPTSNLQEWSGEPGTLAPAVAFHLPTDLKEWVGEPVTSQVICAPVHCQVHLPAFAIHLHICLQMILY